jgi:hypothetical protein
MFLKILVFLMIAYWVLKVFRQLFPPSYEPNRVQQEQEKAYREYLIRKKAGRGKSHHRTQIQNSWPWPCRYGRIC